MPRGIPSGLPPCPAAPPAALSMPNAPRRTTDETASAPETEALAADLAATLQPGDVVLVSGELGAGKTTFVRGACRALGVEVPVTSPTFVVGVAYEGARGPLAHLDLYRLGGMGTQDPGPPGPVLRPHP